jgi:hypothetical protein
LKIAIFNHHLSILDLLPLPCPISGAFVFSTINSLNPKHSPQTTDHSEIYLNPCDSTIELLKHVEAAGIEQTIRSVSKTLVLCIMNRGLQFSPRGATMDQDLMDLRKRMIRTSIEFIRAQRALVKAAAPEARRSKTKLKEAVEEYLKAAEPYDAALEELREYLIAAEPTEAIVEELDHTERLIDALDTEKKVGLKLRAHHMNVKSERN